MPQTNNAEWLNQNSLRNYPFKENASLVPRDSTGLPIVGIRLPNYLVVDFVLTMPTSSLPHVYLAQLAVVGSVLSFIFKESSGLVIATLAVPVAAHVTNQAYDLVGTGSFDDVRGRVVLGDLSRLAVDLGEGLYEFQLNDAELETTTVRPGLRGIRSLQLSNNGILSELIYGHVKLLGGSNVLLTYLPAYNAIKIDAIDGGGLNETCTCEEDVGQQNIVRHINGLNIEDAWIQGDGQCVKVEVVGNKIVISDVCSTPCCGCPELEDLTNALKILEVSLSNLESYANQLHERIETFVSNFVLTVGT